MQVHRTIGDHEVLVETSEANGIWLEDGLLASTPATAAKKEILRALSTGEDYYPLSVHWELLDRCNFACPFCYIVGHSFESIVRYREIQTVLSELIDEGMLFCTLTGGEVTIHPDFIAIYSHLKKSGVVVEVFTNGFAIDNDVLELFRSYPPSAVEVSLYSVENTRLTDVYGAKSTTAASSVLANVLRMKHAGVHVVCKTFLNSVTQPDVLEIAKWCAVHQVEHYSSSKMTAAYDGSPLRAHEILPLEVRRPAQPPKAPVCFPCGTRNYGAAIDASFRLFPCPTIRLTDCRFDLRALGGKDAVSRVKQFVRRFQDSEIAGVAAVNRATCLAHARPVRGSNGEVLAFEQPS